MMRYVAAGLALALVGLMPGPAGAAVFTYVVTGIVATDASVDSAPFGGNVAGSIFSARFEVDDGLPLALYAQDATGSSAQGGGLIQAGTRPPVTATLTINGIDYRIRTGNRRETPVCYPELNECFGSSRNERDAGSIVKNATARTLALAGAYEDRDASPGLFLRTAIDGLDFSLGSPAFTAPDYRQGGTFAVTGSGRFATSYEMIEYSGNITSTLTQLSLVPNWLRVTGSVPEPATWVTMILGFAMIGGSLRARGRIAPHAC